MPHELCEGYKHKIIYRVVHIHNHSDFTKYLFVGPGLDKKVQKALERLTKLSYTNLDKNDENLIDKHIPSFSKKFGELKIGKCKFVYDYIDNDDTIKQIRAKLTKYLSNPEQKKILLPDEQHLWTKTKSQSFESFIRFINTIFRNDESVDKFHMYHYLKILLGVKTNQDVNNIIMKKMNKDSALISQKNTFEYQKVINDDEIKILFQSKHTVLGHLYARTGRGYQYEQLIVINPFNMDVKDDENIIRTEESDFSSYTLGSYGALDDNEIFLVSYSDFIKNYQLEDADTKSHKYWNMRLLAITSNKRNNIYQYCLKSTDDLLDINQKLAMIQKKYEPGKKYSLLKCQLTEFLVMEINSNHMRNFLDMEQLFYLFELDSANFPFVRYVVREDYSKFKMSKTFIAENRPQLIYSWRIIRWLNRINYPQKAGFLLFKIMVGRTSRDEREKHFTVFLYPNGYMIVEYQMKQPEDIKKVQEYLGVFHKFIERRLNKYTRSKYLLAPEIDKIFKPQLDKKSGPRANLRLFNFKLTYEITSANHNIYKLFNIVSYYIPFYYCYMKTNGLHMHYKKVDKFTSDESVINFIQKLFETDKKINYQKKLQYKNLISTIFGLDQDDVMSRIENVRLQEPKNRPYFLYTIDISIYQDKNNYSVIINNLKSVNQLMNVTYLLELLFRQLSNYTELSSIYHHNKTYDTGIIAFEPTTTNKYVTGDDTKYADDEMNFLDMDLDLDLAEFVNEDNEDNKDNKDNKDEVNTDVTMYTHNSKVTLDKSNIQKYTNRSGKLTFTNYMTQMRELADTELYKFEDISTGDQKNKKKQTFSYSRVCDNTQMRQPYILTKEEFDQVDDKESITGYMKYRNRYYICPRIWDYKAKKPISVKKFIKTGLKSPYTGGEAIPSEKRSKYDLGDKYTVIVRKHTGGNYWENSDAEKDWPKILKGTGKKMFPGFSKTDSHPKKLCLPCCFSNVPQDYDPANNNIQNLKKPYGVSHRCFVDPDNDEQKKRKIEDYDELSIRNENYILASNAGLSNNRYGMLPEHIDILLRNNQDIFVDNNSLHEGSNCFLRKGIINDNKTFLRCIASVKGIRYAQLIDLIVNNITPSLFVTLNNGNIVARFKDKSTLPNGQKKFSYFMEFIRRHSVFCKQYDIEENNTIKNVNDLLNNTIISDDKRKAYQRLYIIVSALRNFLEYCRDTEIIFRRHTMFLDLFSRKLDWLFPKGTNIIIFYKDTGNMYCNPYIKHLNKPIIMLLMDNIKRFEPIFHVLLRHKIKARGIFEINHDIDLSYKQSLNMKERTSNIELIHNSQKRSYIFKQLLVLHKDNCRDTYDHDIPIKFRLFEAIRINDSLNNLSPEYNIVSQVINIINKVLYLVTYNGTIIPVKPSSTIPKLKLIFLENMLNDITIPLPKMLLQLNQLDEKSNGKLRINPISLIKQKSHSTTIIGILTEAHSIIPITPYSIKQIQKTIKLPIIVRNIYLDIDYRIYDKQDYEDNRISSLDNITYLEMLYEQFKYEFSHIMSVNKSRVIKQDIRRIFNNNMMSVKDKYLQLYPILFELMFDISHLVNESVGKLGENLHTKVTKNFRAHYCTKLQRPACIKNIFCEYSKKVKKNKCRLQLTPSLLEKYTGSLTEEILRDPRTRDMLFEDDYLPDFVKKQGRYEKEDDIYLTSDDYTKYKVVYSSSKYHDDNFELYDVKNPTKDQKIIKPSYQLDDGSTMRSGTSTTRDSSLSKLKKGTQRLKNVYATVFDKDGKFRAQYKAGPCLFPYVYANNKQLVYECNKDKAEGQRCPTELDEHHRAVKWGFCPTDPIKTRHTKKVKDIYASKGKKKGPDYREGKCVFPFRYHPSYDLSWDCVSTKHDDHDKWCATSLKVGQNMYKDLPIAADKTDDIYQKKWNWEKIYKDSDNYAFNNDFLRYKTRGYCEGGRKKNILESEIPSISLDDFDVNKCEKTESKGGYSKKVLINFAHDVLGIDMSELTDKNGKKTKKKPELCKIIIVKYKDIRNINPPKDVNLLNIYTKDPKQCEKGDKGGGYYLTYLRKMAINYFNMDPEKAKIANKKDLCSFIKPILQSEIQKQGVTHKTSSAKSDIKLAKIYQRNPLYCEKGPKSGGYDIKELKHIAHKYFGIRMEISRKEELCKEIRDALEQEAIVHTSSTVSTKWGKTGSKTSKNLSSYYGYDGYSDDYSPNQTRYSLPSVSEKRNRMTTTKKVNDVKALKHFRKKKSIKRLETLPSSTSVSRISKHKNNNQSLSQAKYHKKHHKKNSKRHKPYSTKRSKRHSL
jgi:hypothetical protein